ncbi:hypothetical protein ACFL51_02265, partial [Myxococcota bacterium]
SDPKLKAIRAFGVKQQGRAIAVPSVFLVIPSGEVLWRYVGRSMTDRPSIDRILLELERI